MDRPLAEARMQLAARRKGYIAIAQRRVRPGSGSHLAFLQWRTFTQPVMDLTQVIRRTRFVVVGAVAARLYMPERATRDVDILVRPADAPGVEGELRSAGAEKLGDLSIGGSSWRFADGTLLDVIESDEPWVGAAIQNPRTGPDGLPYIALPYLVVMKLQASRAQDIADISRMLGAADDQSLDEVRQAVRAYAPDAAEDLESLIALGRLELDGGRQ